MIQFPNNNAIMIYVTKWHILNTCAIQFRPYIFICNLSNFSKFYLYAIFRRDV
jgi:hypothetical protein